MLRRILDARRLTPRLRAAGIHLGLSVVVASVAALLVFGLWYPPPFATIAGGLELFLLLVSVDVVTGPVLTAVAASAGKPRTELVHDLALIVTLQLAALGYGLYSMALARPVAVAFEVDLFRIVSAADIDAATLADAPTALRDLSWTGPTLIAAVKPSDPTEQLKAIELGLAGVHLSYLPRFWHEYPSSSNAAWRAARPLTAVVVKYPKALGPATVIARKAGRQIEELRFLPLVARRESWIAVVAKPGATIAGYIPVDGFF